MNPAVPTVSYTRILRGAVTRAGEVWPCDRALLGVFMGGIATAIARAWTYFEWPLLLDLDERSYYDGAWDVATAYAEDDVVWHDSRPWICTASGGSTGTEPVVDGDDWAPADELEPVAIAGGFLYLEDPSLVVEVYQDDPRAVKYPRRMCWRPESLVVSGTSIQQVGVRVWPASGRDADFPDTVWKLERYAVPMLEGGEYDPTLAYAAGDGMWWPASAGGTDLFYKCLTATTAGQTPGTHASKWSSQKIPAFLEQHLIFSAVASYLKAEKGAGPQSKAAEQEAEKELEDEMRKAQESDRRQSPAKRM